MKSHPRLQRGGCMWCPENSDSTEIRLQGMCECNQYRPTLHWASRCHCGHGEVWHRNNFEFRQKLENFCIQHTDKLHYIKSIHLQQKSLEKKLGKQSHDMCELLEKITQLKRQQRVQQTQQTTAYCVICMHNPRNVVLLPCRHSQFCKECAERLAQKKGARCPLCRSRVECVLNILT